MNRKLPISVGAAGVVVVAVVLMATAATATRFSPWGAPTNAESVPGTSTELNTPYLDGCPIQSPDGLSLFMASNRPGGLGGLDLWVANRATKDAAWGAPQNLGAPVNSGADDFCPTPVGRNRLYFVSSREGGCGGPDIYVTRRTESGGWARPRNLGCQVNSPAGEASPSLVNEDGTRVLYFSSTRAGGFAPEEGSPPDSDIYHAVIQGDRTFGPAALVPVVNTASDDARPNVRKDGLEMVFDSNRVGTLGGADIYSAMRGSVDHSWSAPFNLGRRVNTSSSESRPSLSRDGLTLYFGSNRPGSEPDPVTMAPSNDIYFTTRDDLDVSG